MKEKEIQSKLIQSANKLRNSGKNIPQISDAAFCGVSEIIKKIAPETEADPAGMLLTFLTTMGNACGRNCYYEVEATRHYSNLFAALVGDTSKARKGTSFSIVKKIMAIISPEWVKNNIRSGLSSGEGLKYFVRDEIIKTNEKGEESIVDAGIKDKRLFIFEAEFASALKAASRPSNTLSPTVRDAWDTGNLSTLTKNEPTTAIGAHISILAHITVHELLKSLTDVDASNGLANRFLWGYVERKNILPHGGNNAVFNTIPRDKLQSILKFAETERRITMDSQAHDLWTEKYEVLSNGKPGLVGVITSRAEAQVIRLALIYAILDESIQITQVHLQAAFAVWQYCEDSAKFIFGEKTVNKITDSIYVFLLDKKEGATKTEISEHFKKNKPAEEIDAALNELFDVGKITKIEKKTEGRPITIYKVN